MKEIFDIVGAYNKSLVDNRACALATVVHVEGSSYRRPGARMLVTDNGMLTGAISGGCLEGDALRKALLAIAEGKNKLVTYDTTDEDDAKFGVQLGCNGIVHILFEPILNGKDNPLSLLSKLIEQRRPAVLATLFSLQERTLQYGTCIFCSDDEIITTNKFQDDIITDLKDVLQKQSSQINTYNGGQYSGFLQFIPPPLSFVIIGAGNDAKPLTLLADILGWQTTIIDGRKTHATAKRFPTAKNIIVTKAENVITEITIDDNTACVLMTHNYNYDLTLFKELINTTARYIGILGPKTKMQRMYDDLQNAGIEVPHRDNVFSPMGLDIGAETSEEIALSIAAEIKTVMMKKNAQMLRNKKLLIHS